MTEKIEGEEEYYEALKELNTPTTLSGRVTAAMHYAEPKTFKAKDNTPINKESVCKAIEANGYSVVVDTKGTLQWDSDLVDDKPLICILSEQVSQDYLDYLYDKDISWIACGKESIDLHRAMDILNTEFSVKRMVVVGGGHINGTFLNEGLLDEVSMMYAPGIDGRGGMTAAFDGISADSEPFQLKLNSVKQYECGTVWMRYAIK